MEPVRYLPALRRRWTTVVATTLLALAAAALLLARATPQYASTTTLFFSVARADTVSELSQGSTYTQGLMQSFADLVRQPLVLDNVVAELALPTTSSELARRVTTEVVGEDTFLLDVTVTDADPGRAAATADAVGRRTGQVVSALTTGGAPGERGGAVRVVLAAGAQPADSPALPRRLPVLGLALLAGLGLGSVLAVLRELLRPGVRDARDVAALTRAPVLAVLPRDARGRPEELRRLRTHLLALDLPRSVVLVAPCTPRDDATAVARSLAAGLRDAGLRPLLVEADLTGPPGTADAPGLAELLAGRSLPADALLHVDGLTVLPAGRAVGPTADRLAGPALPRLLAHLAEDHDVVLVVAPAVLGSADALAVGRACDAAVLVARTRGLDRGTLVRALRELDLGAVPLAGVVLDRGRRRGRAVPAGPAPATEPLAAARAAS